MHCFDAHLFEHDLNSVSVFIFYHQVVLVGGMTLVSSQKWFYTTKAGSIRSSTPLECSKKYALHLRVILLYYDDG
jgi:hypothetical protein